MASDKLPPIPEGAFDGNKESTEIINKKCDHRFALIEANRVKCLKCGMVYMGAGVMELVKLTTPKK